VAERDDEMARLLDWCASVLAAESAYYGFAAEGRRALALLGKML